MAKIAKYRPPIAIPAIEGLSQKAQAQLQDFLRAHLTQIAEDLSGITQDDVAGIVITDTRVEISAGAKRRISPPVAGTVAILEAPSQFNSGAEIVIFLENPRGILTITSSPGIDDGGKVFLPAINGARQATFTAAGVITLRSNGTNEWSTASSFSSESVAANPGAAGATGATGATGADGAQGIPGAFGAEGPEGATGPEGPQGVQGASGAVGPQGPPGIPGSDGPEGPAGADGSAGPAGPPGATGPAGSSGSGGSEGIILDPTELLAFVRTSGTWDLQTSFVDSDGTLGSNTTSFAVAVTSLTTAGAVLDRTVVECSIYCIIAGSFSVTANAVTILGPLSLTAGQRVEFTAAQGWRVYNSDGSEKNTPGATGATGAAGNPATPVGITLSATTHSLETAITGGTYDIETGFVDLTSTTTTGGSQSFDAVGATTIVSAPAASTARVVDFVSISAVTSGIVTVRKDVSGVKTTLVGPYTLAVGARIEFTGLEGWNVYGSDGALIATGGDMPESRIKLRAVGSGTGPPINGTAAQAMEMLGSTNGAVAARNGGSWGSLVSGANGRHLFTDGGGAAVWGDPTSANAGTSLDTTGTISVVPYNNDDIILDAGNGVGFSRNMGRMLWWDDFSSVGTATATAATQIIVPCETNWIMTNTAGGTCTANCFDGGAAGTTDAPGELNIATGIVLGTQVDVHKGSAVTDRPFRANAIRSIKMKAKVTSTAGVHVSLGLNVTSFGALDRAIFDYDVSLSPNWFAKSANSGGATTSSTDTGVAATTSYVEFEIRSPNLASANWEYYLNGALVATHVTTSKSRGMNFYLSIASLAAVNKDLRVDYVSFEGWPTR